MTKTEIRKFYIAKRNQLSRVECEELSYGILRQFQQLDLAGVEYLHLFLPIDQRKEPDTRLIRDWLKTTYPQIKLVYPKTNFADFSMECYLDDEVLEIEVNAIGIPEPVSGNLLDPALIDMVLVPLLAFDKRGYRVGYGKGFYDRFTTNCRPDAKFIGLSFWPPVDLIDDLNEYDQQLTGCITPEQYWAFKNQ
ncbi:5-formyltetrahydrofolate cyclo-ligase [Mucilaginibacter sp. RS28]|uniref:5-formyltetrahydrofolate cyclo-ligase n=1 Tax=Mucilaginibacter straminoryzae TaxID=2932774 RepID=A0A9X1X736_9SPHI|nr:5-formyltetrahydrofolate cyclo-ligase [Mucilaginibacter straminoryzae]MCJ8211791.1 5-formyltetrahydrofolate cyclo-ligase [Mucilaginibacter straminoryzae]